MQYKQLQPYETLDQKQVLQLGELIFQTDPYIFPAMCKVEDAYLLGKLCQSNDDKVFNTSNCFVAVENGTICGLILWHKGPVHWDTTPLQRLAIAEKRMISNQLQLVQEGYFSEYENLKPNTISIMNVCVAESLRGTGIGYNLLCNFLSVHPTSSIELYVLEDNIAAISLYEKVGFVKEYVSFPAFTPDNDQSVKCVKMFRAEYSNI